MTNLETVVFLPFIGEFGYFLVSHISFVNKHRAFSEKSCRIVVCCKKGQELFFPNADEYFTDYISPISSDKLNGMTPNSALKNFFEKIKEKFSGITKFIEPEFKYDRKIGFIPKPKNRDIPEIDVCILARNRAHLQQRNINWDNVVRYLNNKNLKIAIVGLKETTQNTFNNVVYSYDYGDTNDTICSFLNKSRYIFGVASGTSILSSIIKRHHFVVEVPTGLNCRSSLDWYDADYLFNVSNYAYKSEKYLINNVNFYIDFINSNNYNIPI